jgi:hypothetical protein
VKAIYWRDVKALTPPAWVAAVIETELSIVTKWGAELRLVGLDKPDRIEGQPWDEGCIDEYASCKTGIFDGNVRPAIADRRGRVDLIGVPDFAGPAQAEYQDFCDRGRTGVDPDWADFAWGSDGILPAEEIDSMRRSMDPRLFEQETTGRFILPGGRAFPDYDPALHVRDCPYDPALPLCWSLDFNINPMCSGVIQHHMGDVRVVDELVLPDTRTERACEAFLDRAASNGWKLDDLTVYGDATGDARDSTSGTSDWRIVRNMLRDVPGVRFKVPASNPPIKDTVNATNAKLKAADGSVSLRIDRRCRTLAHDLRNALAGDDFESEHCLAWLRYFVHREYPVRSTVPIEPAQFAVL